MRTALSWGSILLALITVGCGKTALTEPGVPRPESLAPALEKSARFVEGLRAMARHDRSNDWSDEACRETVALLLSADGAKDPTPRYDAGLVHQRCRQHAEAKAMFRAALERDPRHPRARAALAMYSAAEGGNLDSVIADLRAAVVDSRFTSIEAMSALATLQMKRRSATADDDGVDDLDRARRNLQRALAIDDGYLPALNQLALMQLDRARRAAGKQGGGKKKNASQELELAALICSQAVRKSPGYAPIHNTAGLVEVELGNLSAASAAFQRARRLDPGLVEAHLNFAAVNLQVRGFAQAEEAYRAVLAQRAEDYDARLGLSLAIRGQLDPLSPGSRLAEAEQQLFAAERLSPERPEAYFNEAILVQEFTARAGGDHEQKAGLLRAKGLFATFLTKAGERVELREAREHAARRVADIDTILGFLGEADRAAN